MLTAVPSQCYDLGLARRRPILTHDNIWESNISPLSSMDSGLEAFSRNPTHGSFSALTFQSTEFDQLCEPTVPLVLNWITVAATTSSVG